MPATASAQTELQSSARALRRELGLRDLILAQILYITIPEFFGTAAKAGQYHVVLWIIAIALFFIPLALVVAHLNRLMPLEGGLYEWARLAFGDAIGFLTAWNIWLYGVVYMGLAGLITTSFVRYALGPDAAWIANTKWVVLTVTCTFITALVFVARVGLGVAKWVTNAGSVFTVLVLAALILAPPLVHVHGPAAKFSPFHAVMPPLTLFTVSVFSKLTFGGLSGFEYIAIFAGEARNAARNLVRSVLFTAPIIAFFYIAGTSAVLYFSSPGAVDVEAAIPQALRLTFQSFGLAGIVVPVSIFMLLVNYLATFNILFNGCSRLPMVAGWDHLLPPWFTRLHPRFKTPVNSIYFAGAIAMMASIVALRGVDVQEAFELLLIWAFAFYATAYLALFAIPLLASKRLAVRPAIWLRMAAVSGLLATMLYIALSIFPIIDVQSTSEYSAKTAGVILGANLAGMLLYWWRNRVRLQHPR